MNLSAESRRRIGRIAAISIIAAMILGASGWAERERNKEEEYSVYSAYLSEGLLNDAHDWSVGGPVQVVIQDRTISGANLRFRLLYLLDGRVHFDELHTLTRVSYLVRNLFQTQILPKLKLPSRATVHLSTQSDYGSAEFQKKFPRNMGLVVFSGVGFNPSRTQALFYINHFCGLCGGGRYVLMEKLNGVWRVQTEHYIWIS